jgi:predicted SAM-dependent methyltransferase
MALKPLILGVATFIPGMSYLRELRTKGTGGTISADYCYSVWLRHLVHAQQNGLSKVPEIVAELGPGDSIGVGLAALLSGSEKYFAFDVVSYSDLQRNLNIFDELISLFRSRAAIPGAEKFPKIKPNLDCYDFPASILTDELLEESLAESRIKRIRDSLENASSKDSLIQYKAPWFESGTLETESVDMVFSQAVLEHVDQLESSYSAMHSWLKPQGMMSHQIDFKCHGTADEWNGHWTYSDFAWRLIRGTRAYLLNREPYSTHKRLLKEIGFNVVGEQTVMTASALKRNQLAERFKKLSDEDLSTSDAFIQLIK